MDSPYRQELLLAFAAIQASATITQSVLAAHQQTNLIEKDDLSPVTVADFAVQAVLTSVLASAYPNDTFVGEESASELRNTSALLEIVWKYVSDLQNSQSHHEAGSKPHSQDTKLVLPKSKEELCDLIDRCGSGKPKTGRTWVFDPIDGTKTFIRGELYAINVALLVDGRQALSAVGCPMLAMDSKAPLRNEDVDPENEGCILFAVKDHGAHVRPLKGTVEEVQPRRLPRHEPATKPEEVRFSGCTTIVDSGLNDIHAIIASHLTNPSSLSASSNNPSSSTADWIPTCDLGAWVLRWTALALGLANTTIWIYNKPTRYAKIWDHAGAVLLFEETGGMVTDVNGKELDWLAGRKMAGNVGFVGTRGGKEAHGRVVEVVRNVLRAHGKGKYLN